MPRSPFDTTFDESESRDSSVLPTTSSSDTYAATSSGIGLGFVVFMGVSWAIVSSESDRSIQIFLVCVMMALDMLTFVAGVMGLVFGIRALTFSTTNRFSSYFGLITGILLLLLSGVVGLVITCVGLIFMVGG